MQEKAIKETKKRGFTNFPYEVYRCRIPETFPFFPLHYHDDFEIVYVLEGTLDAIIHAQRFECSAGDILIIPPQKIHGFFQYKNTPCHYTNIVFSLSLLESPDSEIFKKLLQPYENDQITVPYFHKKETLFNTEIIESVISLFENRHEAVLKPFLVKSDLFRIFHYLQEIVSAREVKLNNSELYANKLIPVFKYVSENYKNPISVSDAAQLVHFSESHFMNIFKKISGTSFTNYVKMIRLENARVMLLSSDKSVQQIADECGFEDISYFIRSFKQYIKLSPLKYKKLAVI